MTPALQPVPTRPAVTPFRERLLKGNVAKAADNKATVHLPMEVSEDGNFLVVRIPRHMSYSDLRTKDSFTDDAGKFHKESAMVTVNTLGLKDTDYSMTFTDDESKTCLEMKVRPAVTLNISCDYGTVQLTNSENGDPAGA